MLYWCGIREGELLALTAADFNFEKETVRINKSYQRLHGEDVITTPKTKKSAKMFGSYGSILYFCSRIGCIPFPLIFEI